LHAPEDSLEIRTENEKKFSKEIPFDMPVKQETAKATYKNGVLSVKITKREGEEEEDYYIAGLSEERAWRRRWKCIVGYGLKYWVCDFVL